MTSAPSPSSALGPRSGPSAPALRLPDSLQPGRDRRPPGAPVLGRRRARFQSARGRGAGGARGGESSRASGGASPAGSRLQEMRAARPSAAASGAERDTGPRTRLRDAPAGLRARLPSPRPLTAALVPDPAGRVERPGAAQIRPPRGAAPEGTPKGNDVEGRGGREGALSTTKRPRFQRRLGNRRPHSPRRPSRSLIRAQTRRPGAGPQQVAGCMGSLQPPSGVPDSEGPWSPGHDLPTLSSPGPFLGRPALPTRQAAGLCEGGESAAERPRESPRTHGNAPRTGLLRRGRPLSMAGGRRTGEGQRDRI